MTKSKILKGLFISLGILIIGLYAFSPLISSKYGIFNYEFVKLWFVYIVVCLGWTIVGLISILRWKIPLLPKKIFNVLFFFTFIYILASIFGLSPKDSLIGRYGLWIHSLSTLFVFLSIFYFIYLSTIIKKEQFIMYFYMAITSSAVLTVLQELLKKERLDIWIFLDEGRITGPFRNPNHFGFYLSLVFVFTLWLSFVNKERLFKFFSFFCLFNITFRAYSYTIKSQLAVSFLDLRNNAGYFPQVI